MLNYRVLDMRENGTFYKLFQFQFKKDREMKILVVSVVNILEHTPFNSYPLNNLMRLILSCQQ